MLRAILALERYNDWWFDRTPMLIGIPVFLVSDLTIGVAVAAILSLPALLF